MSACVLCGYSRNHCEAKFDRGHKVTFHVFPRQQNVREEWASFCGLAVAQLASTAALCSKHFAAHDFIYRALRRQLKKGTVPCLAGPDISPGPSRRGPPPPPPPPLLPPPPMEMNISSAASTSRVEELLPEPYAAPNTLLVNGQSAEMTFDSDSRSNRGQNSAKDGQNILTKGLAENDLSTALSSSITRVDDGISEPFQYNLECCSTDNLEQNNLSVDHTYCVSDVRMPRGAERSNVALGVTEMLCVKTAENGSPRVYPGAAKAFCAPPSGNYALRPEAAELCAAPSVCDSLCRMCGHHGTDLVSLHSTSTEGDELSLLEKMQMHLGLETNSEDGMPQKICLKCEKALNSWQEAFVNFIVADTVLRKYCEAEVHKLKNMSSCTEEQSSYNRITSQCRGRASADSHLLKAAHRDTERKDAATNTEDTEEDEFDFIFSGNLWFNKEVECVCHMCKVIFRDMYELFEHFAECGKASYLCDRCGTDVGSRAGVAVRAHENAHMIGQDMKFVVDPPRRESKLYRCRLCKVIFKDRFELLEHRGQCEQTSYLCDTCGAVLGRRRNAWKHHRKHVQIQHDMSSDYECKTCGKHFDSKKNLARHASIHTQNVCEICSELFATPYLLQQHRLTHDCVLKFYCEPCCKMYLSASALTLHQRQVHQNMPAIPFRDRVCSISHGDNGEENYSCKVCSAVLENMQSLITHLNEPKCLKCPQCNKTICNERKYFVHISRCKLQCRFCGQVLRSCETLRDHENQHTGHQPHKCKFCGKAFSTFAQKRNHQEKHVGPGYACDICGKTFFKRFLLHNHVLKHQGVKFECSVCKKLYASKRNLYKHTRKFHRKVTD